MKIKLRLDRLAKKSGADRYEAIGFLDHGRPYRIYIPQEISRPNGTPLTGLVMTIEEETEGGDR